ncbi:hypothetical protein HPP92_013131 [Vanilla planifolia]|uniref:Uncharacterized protein n=1 Tax=Vanilla planifolia TaxID=51239 RepID=A0A835UXP7_VANPL|nr:hypothetical protein HPP92_013131 [Vanilla planifolia]
MGNRKVFDFLTATSRVVTAAVKPPERRSLWAEGGAARSAAERSGDISDRAENVWKYGNKKTRAEEELAAADSSSRVDRNPSWEPFATQNVGFEEYYKSSELETLLAWLKWNFLGVLFYLL